MVMTCPKCNSNSIKEIDNHYFCNVCFAEFQFVVDKKKYFPCNCIFPKRSISEFYRKPYFDFNQSN